MSRMRRLRPAAEVAGLFVAYAAAALVLFRAAILGHRTFFGFGDAAMQSYPWLLDVAHAARHGQLLLWDFGTQAGTSFAGELQPAPFYPVTWLLGLSGLDGIRLCDAYVLLHFGLAGASMHLLARREGLSHPAATVGALLFGFCGYLPYQAVAQPNIFASLCWLPLVLLLARRAFAATRWSGGVLFASLAGVAGGMQIAAGHLQPFVHSSYAVLICGVAASLSANGGRRNLRPVVLALLGQAMAVGFAAVPIELARQYLQLVYRWYASGMSRWPHAVPSAAYAQGAALEWGDLGGLLHRSTLRELDGSLYLTVAGALLALAGLLARSRLAMAMAGTALFALLAGLGGHAGPLVRVFFHLPLLPQLRTPVRAAYLLSFALALLAAIGAEEVLTRLRRLLPAAGPPAAVLLVLLVGVPVAAFDRPIGAPEGGPLDARTYYGSAALQEVEALSNAGPLVDRVIGLPRDVIPANAGDIVPVLNVTGQRATMLASLFDYLAGGWDPVGSRQLDRLGVRWVVADHPIGGLRLRAQGTGWRIYERPGALSVLWTRGAVGVDADDRRPAPVRRVRWQPNRVEFDLAALPAATRLVFAQPAYPGWQASVDGRRVALGREEIFPAILLPAGAHRVVFAYRPSLRAGLLLTLGCCFVLGGGWMWERKARGAAPGPRQRRGV